MGGIGMNGWMDTPNLVMSASALLLMLQGLLVVVLIPGVDRWSKRYFITIFSVLVLCAAVYFVDTIIYRYPSMALAERAAIYLESLLSSMLMPMLTVYLLHCCGEDWRKSGLMRIVMTLWTVYFILLGVTQFTTFIYYVTPDNHYYRGPWYPLLLTAPEATMLVNLVGVVRRRNQLSRKYYCAFLIYLIVPMVAMLVQMLFFGLLFIGIGMALAALLMFAIILSDQIEQHMRHQREIAQQRASIMVLQMRPHFIYNAMTSIYYLCDQDPEKAKRVTMDFTTYLRKNFTAVASEDVIPFSEELEHTRAYLAVEQAQFEDSLFVDYDTPHTQFHVPPLTLQPIVENAVKHGRDPYAGVFHLLIRTRKTDTGSEIIIADNGRGFAPVDDSEPHIALKNIRQRLEMMCRGSLAITRADGGGTIVTVTIPDAAKSHPS